MQVTGSKNRANTATRLSIRIPSGQSLRMEHRPAEVSSGGSLEIVVEGPKVAPLPCGLVEQTDLRAMLAATGVELSEGESIVTTHAEGSIAYAIVLDAESRQVVEAWRCEGLEVGFSTPLAKVVARAIAGSRRPKTVVLRLAEGVAYVALAVEHQIRYAEAMPLEGEEQLVNLLALLEQDFEVRKARFVLLGTESHNHYKTFRRYFRRVSCEK